MEDLVGKEIWQVIAPSLEGWDRKIDFWKIGSEGIKYFKILREDWNGRNFARTKKIPENYFKWNYIMNNILNASMIMEKDAIRNCPNGFLLFSCEDFSLRYREREKRMDKGLRNEAGKDRGKVFQDKRVSGRLPCPLISPNAKKRVFQQIRF